MSHSHSTSPRTRILLRLVFLVVGLVVFNFLLPRLVLFIDQVPALETIDVRWFVVIFFLELGAFVSFWELTRIAVPGVSWFVAATAQLAANAAAKVMPGGAMVGGALYFRMLAVSGVPQGQAAAALAATSFISTLVLLALPAVAVVIAALSAPIPRGLLPVALLGTVLFAVVFATALVLVTTNRPLLLVGRLVERLVGWLARRLHKPWRASTESFLHRRDEVIAALGARWKKALGVAVLNWTLDYLALFVALVAVGARPRVSIVLLAFAAAAVLGMVPITPGGLGFVELGLTGVLTLSGIPGTDAALATLAYRLFQFWLPIPAGAVAYLLFRIRHGRLEDLIQPTP
ncbi:MAG TPA: flippase-like domain-containing protein [Actinobacteria bacterium]|nr:flippase-like domain-containing protein [Actinomycetota bacterium]